MPVGIENAEVPVLPGWEYNLSYCSFQAAAHLCLPPGVVYFL